MATSTHNSPTSSEPCYGQWIWENVGTRKKPDIRRECPTCGARQAWRKVKNTASWHDMPLNPKPGTNINEYAVRKEPPPDEP